MSIATDNDVLESALLTISKIYSSLSFIPPHFQYTVLASFFLSHRLKATSKVISIATGTKCLPAVKLSPRGEALHDSHAEVLARRAAVRWLLEEIGRCCENAEYRSEWVRQLENGKYDLCPGVEVNLYVSTVPCGDASMRYLASLQDEEMALLKDSSVFPTLDPSTASRGRDNYARLGVLRTKPGRADSPPTLCMSCSDKIAAWSVVGFQGALVSAFFVPLYISRIIIGEVPSSTQEMTREDCERAFGKRIGTILDLPSGYKIKIPIISFTSTQFTHSRSAMLLNGGGSSSCNESLCWIADNIGHEVLINGLKRGVSPKHRYREKSRPSVSRIALFQLYTKVLRCIDSSQSSTTSYYAAKQESTDYQTAKQKLLGAGNQFSGWARTGYEWQQFLLDGNTTPLS